MILALIDHDRGTLNSISLEMLTLAQNLTKALSCPLEAILIGENARTLADELSAYGVTKAHLIQHEQLDEYAPEAWAQSIIHLREMVSPQAIISPGSERGNEVMAHVAARTDLPLAVNCTDVQPGDSYQVTRVRWGGSLLEEALLKGEPKLLTVAPHMITAEKTSESSEIHIQEVPVSLDEKDFRVRVTSRVQPGSDKVSLTDANVVVSGGRGVGSVEGFESLDELASLLGGAVGCSRAVTNNGWRPHADQVGQTGARVAPDLYIACGISGAIQHIAGCKGSKQILVINTDPEAPILAKADYAVLGDLHEVVPAISEGVRRVKGSST